MKAPQCKVDPPTPVPLLFGPKAVGVAPPLRRSSIQMMSVPSVSSGVCSAGAQLRPASSATTRKPRAASVASNGAPPAPVPITTASTTSRSS